MGEAPFFFSFLLSFLFSYFLLIFFCCCCCHYCQWSALTDWEDEKYEINRLQCSFGHQVKQSRGMCATTYPYFYLLSLFCIKKDLHWEIFVFFFPFPFFSRQQQLTMYMYITQDPLTSRISNKRLKRYKTDSDIPRADPNRVITTRTKP